MNLAAIYVILFLACTLYAIVLDHLGERYVPNWTFVTVIIGDMFILAGAAAIVQYVPLSGWGLWWAFAGCFIAAGLPIIGWQLFQIYRRFRERS